jgi:hypothetical protein
MNIQRPVDEATHTGSPRDVNLEAALQVDMSCGREVEHISPLEMIAYMLEVKRSICCNGVQT